uniref:Uncharacterized protein n=1 Tax=Steinernema glaseri TaxID=37863 RepID=A0A1I8A3E9_9BILA
MSLSTEEVKSIASFLVAKINADADFRSYSESIMEDKNCANRFYPYFIRHWESIADAVQEKYPKVIGRSDLMLLAWHRSYKPPLEAIVDRASDVAFFFISYVGRNLKDFKNVSLEDPILDLKYDINKRFGDSGRQYLEDLQREQESSVGSIGQKWQNIANAFNIKFEAKLEAVLLERKCRNLRRRNANAYRPYPVAHRYTAPSQVSDITLLQLLMKVVGQDAILRQSHLAGSHASQPLGEFLSRDDSEANDDNDDD